MPRGLGSAIVTIASSVVINPVMRGSKNEPRIGKNCQHTLDEAWNRTVANTLLRVLLYSQTMMTRCETVHTDHRHQLMWVHRSEYPEWDGNSECQQDKR